MIVIWCDWKGELYAFCSWECQHRYEVWVCDPNYFLERATRTDASFGCIWCGGDLTAGVEWFSEAPLHSEAREVPRHWGGQRRRAA